MTSTVESPISAPIGEQRSGEPAVEAQVRPYRSGLAVAGLSYLLLTGVLLAIGLLLTHPLNGSVGRWDQHVNEYLANRRTPDWNSISGIATASFNTLPVIAAATLLVGFLALRRRFREAAFLTVALFIEITVFLSVTFVVARPRPDVVRLNSTPATSSFPSGHTAAATVLFVGIAVIVTWCTRHRIARVAAWTLAVFVPVMVGFGRVYRGLHHPTDVVVGALFGIACVACAALVVNTTSRKLGERKASEIRTTV